MSVHLNGRANFGQYYLKTLCQQQLDFTLPALIIFHYKTGLECSKWILRSFVALILFTDEATYVNLLKTASKLLLVSLFPRTTGASLYISFLTDTFAYFLRKCAFGQKFNI